MSSSSYDSTPFLHANIFSRFILHWVSPLLKKSHQQGVLHLNDLYDLPTYLKSTELTDKLERNWFNELKRCPNHPSLIRAMLQTLGWKPFLHGFFALLNGIIQVIQPLLLTFLMRFFESCSSMATWHAWLLAIATILTALSSSLINQPYIYRNDIYAIQVMIAYTGLIYRKILRLSSHSMNDITSGEITNLVANDARMIEMTVYFFNYLWVAPLQLILVIFVFWHFVKYIAFIAIGYSLFLLLMQPLYGRIFVHLREKIVQVTDERIKIMSEIIKSIRIVKMYCWESAFVKKISLIRKREILQNTLYAICDSIQFNIYGAGITDVEVTFVLYCVRLLLIADVVSLRLIFFSNPTYTCYDIPLSGSDPNVGRIRDAVEIFNTDDPKYGGSGTFQNEQIEIKRNNGQDTVLTAALPSLWTIILEENLA